MKTLITLIVSSLAFFSRAAAESGYAYLSDFKLGANPTMQVDVIGLVKPSVAVARGQLPSTDARHYKMVFVIQGDELQTLKVSPKANVTLLTFPNLAPKTASLRYLRSMLDKDGDALPIEFELGDIFKYTLTNQIITSITQVNTRAITGVFEQAVILSVGTTFRPLKLVLNFINIYTTIRGARRVGKIIDYSNSQFWIISDQNSLLRSFKLAKNGRITLLSSSRLGFINCLSAEPLDRVDATLTQLETGFNGTGNRWDYPEKTFWATISDVTNEVLEFNQTYVGC